MKKFIKFILILLALVIIGFGVYFGYKTFFNKEDVTTEKNEKKPKEVKKLQIFDENSNDRDVAVMINNNHSAWPHAGLQDSYVNYEIIVEGGITRIMAVYSSLDKMPEKIGSVRSSRIYFLDYAMENDALYIHWGGSAEAYNDMASLNMDHLDGIYYEGSYFYRESISGRAYEHTGFTRGSLIKNGVNNKGFRTTSDNKSVFNYSVDEIELSRKEGAIKADYIDIEYSSYQTTKYEYDPENKVYKRSMTDYGEATPHTDIDTNKQYTAKNIITYQVENHSYDYYGRQALTNIGSGEGYYITNGYAYPIVWEKTSRGSKTVYKYKDTNEEIKLNDGNTWVQIQPINKNLSITSNEVVTYE